MLLSEEKFGFRFRLIVCIMNHEKVDLSQIHSMKLVDLKFFRVDYEEFLGILLVESFEIDVGIVGS
jgi:hypothetical protein